MNIKVIYHSSTGNTAKLAEAIANCLQVRAEPVGEAQTAFSETVDLLFLGDGIYFGKAHKKIRSLIESLTPDKVKNVAVFATYGGQEKIGADITTLLRNRGLNIVGAPFTCKGQAWLLINRHHPDDTDLQKAKEFAKNIVATIQ